MLTEVRNILIIVCLSIAGITSYRCATLLTENSELNLDAPVRLLMGESKAASRWKDDGLPTNASVTSPFRVDGKSTPPASVELTPSLHAAAASAYSLTLTSK
jgi:hypothetical protein